MMDLLSSAALIAAVARRLASSLCARVRLEALPSEVTTVVPLEQLGSFHFSFLVCRHTLSAVPMMR